MRVISEWAEWLWSAEADSDEPVEAKESRILAGN